MKNPYPALAARTASIVQGLTTLQVAIAISLALHAGLLGVRLVNPQGFDRFFEDTPLEVLLVNAKSNDAPVKAQALAQSNLAGGGDMDAGLASSPLPVAGVTEVGDSLEDSSKQIEQMMEVQQQILTQVRRELASIPPPDPRREANDAQEIAKEERRRQLLEQLAVIEKRINAQNSRPKRRFVSPATREVVYALYYDQVRRKIEDHGTRNFPQVNGKRLYGDLTMMITVDAQGRVVDSEVVIPSGNLALDKRAMAIVHAAAPYGLFSAEARRQADQLVMTTRFRFDNEGLETKMVAPQ